MFNSIVVLEVLGFALVGAGIDFESGLLICTGIGFVVCGTIKAMNKILP